MSERGPAERLPSAVFVIAGVVICVLLLVASGYGFHRDEMYFILAGRHPDFGYVDQPPLTPLLSAGAAWLLGVTPFAVRVLPALTAGLGVVLTADITRRFGGSRLSQGLAALIVGISGWLGAGHLDETATFDIAFWTVAIWLLVPALSATSTAPRSGLRWLGIGLVVGLALENKTLAIALPGTVGASLLLLRRWDVLRSPWPWAAAALAVVIWVPNLAWQATHGFTQLTMAGHIAQGQAGIDGRLRSMVELLALTGPLLFPVSIAGVAWLIRSPASRAWRALGLAIMLQVALMLAIGGKSYYSAGYIPLAIAAGSVPLGGWLGAGRRRLRRWSFGLASAASGSAVAVLLLPIVPVAALHATPIPSIYGESVAQVGWPQLAAQVESVVATVPAVERASAAVVTANYGQYSALVLLGRNLPPVFSGHNSVADWGEPADGAAPVVTVGFSLSAADAYFEGCRVAAIVDNGFDLPTEEQGSPIVVCDGPRMAWHTLWPRLRHIN